MNKLFLIISIVLVGFPIIAQKKITANFDAPEILNEFISMDSLELKNYKEFLTNMDIPLIEEYLGLLQEMKFEEADRLIQKDNKLKNIPERAIALSYTFYFVNENDLLGEYALTCINEKREMNMVVYMDEKSFIKYSKKLDQPLTLKIELIQEIPLTQTLLYRLK